MEHLNNKVITMFENNPMIKPIKFTSEEIVDQGIPFDIKLLQLL